MVGSREENGERKGGKYLEKENILFSRWEGKGGKYLEKKNIHSTEEKNEKKESFGEGKLMLTPTDRANIEQCAFLKEKRQRFAITPYYLVI